jgi:predicted RND superfamily exporter protein
MLLTFTVFMSMVTDELPATDTLSNFNIFLLIQMVFSTVITICVLLIHYIYKKGEDKPSPKWLNWIVTRRYNSTFLMKCIIITIHKYHILYFLPSKHQFIYCPSPIQPSCNKRIQTRLE